MFVFLGHVSVLLKHLPALLKDMDDRVVALCPGWTSGPLLKQVCSLQLTHSYYPRKATRPPQPPQHAVACEVYAFNLPEISFEYDMQHLGYSAAFPIQSLPARLGVRAFFSLSSASTCDNNFFSLFAGEDWYQQPPSGAGDSPAWLGCTSLPPSASDPERAISGRVYPDHEY